jgi:hypothetical protein
MAKFQEFDVNWGVALFLSPVVTVKMITNLIQGVPKKYRNYPIVII